MLAANSDAHTFSKYLIFFNIFLFPTLLHVIVFCMHNKFLNKCYIEMSAPFPFTFAVFITILFLNLNE